MSNIDNAKVKENIDNKITLKDLVEEINQINKTINYILELIKTRNF